MDASCPNCGSSDIREFCPRCGQRAWHGRLSMRRVLGDVHAALTDADRSYARTARDLTTRPGDVVWGWLRGRTVVHVQPMKYLALIVGVVAVLTVVTGIAEPRESELAAIPPEMRQHVLTYADFVTRWQNLVLAGIVPFGALVTWLVYRPWRLTYAEHVVFNAYVVAQQTLYWIPLLLLSAASDALRMPMTFVYLFVSTGYYVWACGKTFHPDDRLPALARALAALVASYMAYGLAAGLSLAA